MRKRKNYIILIGLLITALWNCTSSIHKLQIDERYNSNSKFVPYFNKASVKPLKKQWKSFYDYLKNGHIQIAENDNGDKDYVFSHSLYKFMNANLLKFYTTPFLQDYNTYIKIFGEPDEVFFNNEKITVAYFRSVIGDPCETCNHDAFGFVFDADSKKLIKE